MRILITGSTGFIGKNLLLLFLEHDYEIVSLSRSNETVFENIDVLSWELGQCLPKLDYSKFDYAIHLAHDFNGIRGAKISIRSNVSIIKDLYDKGLNNQLYFSSYSAGSFAESNYGKSKYIIEKRIKNMAGVTIVRPGLVIGNGGIYKRMKSISQFLPIIPLPDGGERAIPTIDIDTLCMMIYLYIESNNYLSEINLFNKYIKLKDILNSNNKLFPIFFSLPSKLFLTTFRLLGKFNLILPINADNVIGYISNINAKHKSNIDQIAC